jgi:hypothetical protein
MKANPKATVFTAETLKPRRIFFGESGDADSPRCSVLVNKISRSAKSFLFGGLSPPNKKNNFLAFSASLR